MQSILEMVPLLQVFLPLLVCSVAQLRCFIVYLELVTFWDGLGTNHCIYLRYPPTHVSIVTAVQNSIQHADVQIVNSNSP